MDFGQKLLYKHFNKLYKNKNYYIVDYVDIPMDIPLNERVNNYFVSIFAPVDDFPKMKEYINKRQERKGELYRLDRRIFVESIVLDILARSSMLDAESKENFINRIHSINVLDGYYIDNGNHMNHNIFIGKYINEENVEYEIVASNISAKPYSSCIIDDEVKVCNLDSGIETVQQNNTKIPLLLDLSGAYMQDEWRILKCSFAAVEILNNKRVDADPYYSIDLVNLNDIINGNTVIEHAVIGVRDYDSRQLLLSSEKFNGKYIIYPYETAEAECNKHMIYTNILFSSYVFYFGFLQSHYSNYKYLIFYSSDRETRNMADQVVAALNQYSEDIKGEYEYVLNLYDPETLVETVRINLPAGGIIINLLLGELSYQLYKGLYENNFLPPSYIVVSNTVDLLSVPKSYYKYTEGHYFYSIANYNKDSEDAQDLHNTLKKLFYEVDEIPVIEIIQYITIRLYELVKFVDFNGGIDVNFDREIDGDGRIDGDGEIDLLYYMKIMELDPVFESIKVSDNNYVTYNTIISTVEKNDYTNEYERVLLYENRLDIIPNQFAVFGSERAVDIYSCKYDNTGSHKEIINKKYIGLLLPMSGTSFCESISVPINSIISAVSSTVKYMNQKNYGTYSLGYKIINTQSTENGTIDALNEIAEDTDSYMIIIGCIDRICRKYAPEIIPDDKFIWIPTAYPGQICSSVFYSTAALPNQFIDTVVDYLLSTSITKNVYFVYYDDDDFNIYYQIAYNAFDGYFSQKGTLVFTENQEIKAANITTILEELGEGVIVTVTPTELFYSLVTMLFSRNVNMDDYLIFTMNLESTEIENSLSEEYRHRILFYQTYYNDNSSNGRIENILYQYTGLSQLTSVYDNIFDIISLSMSVAEKYNSSKMEDIKKKLIGEKLKSDMGDVELYNNGHLSKYIFIHEYNNNEINLVKSLPYPIIPNPYSWYLDEYYGRVCNYEDETKNTSKIINIILGISLSGMYSNEDAGISDAFNLLINNINNNDKIMDSEIELILVDIQDDSSTCYSSIDKEINEDIYAIFTTGDIECRSLLTNRLTLYNILLFAIGNVVGEEAHENIILASPDPSIHRYYFNYLTSLNLPFSIITSNRPTAKKYGEYINSIISTNGGTIYVYVSVPTTVTNLESIVNNIYTQMKKGIILLALPENILELFDKEIVKKGVEAGEDGYLVYSLLTGEEISGRVKYSYYSLRSTYELLENDKLNNLISELKPIVGNDVYIGESIQVGYATLKIYLDTIRAIDTLEPKEVIKYLYNHEDEDSIFGKFKLLTSHVFSYYERIYSTKENRIISESSRQIIPIVWTKEMNGELYSCDFSDDEVGSKYLLPSIKVGVIYRLHDNNANDHLYIISTTYSFDTINEEGGLHGRYIDPTLIILSGTISDFKTQALSIISLSTTEFMIGGSYEDELNIAIELSQKYKKYWFYPGVSVGSICPEYILFSYPTPNLIIEAYLKTLLRMNVNYFAIIYDDSTVSKSYKSVIESVLSRFTASKHFYLCEYTTNYEEIVKCLSSIEDLHGISICMDDSIIELDFYRYLYNNGYDGTKYEYIHLISDEVISSRLEEEILKNHYFITTFSEAFGNSDDIAYNLYAVEFLSEMRLRTNNGKINAISEGIYDIITLWKSAVQRLYNYDISEIKDSFYGREANTPAGTISISSSNFINRIIYVTKYVNSKFVTVYSTENALKANPWNQYDSSELGYYCDWKTNGGGEKFSRKVKWIGLVYETSNYLISKASTQWYVVIQLIDKINDAGTTLGYYLGCVSMNIVPNEESSAQFIKTVVEYYKPSLMYGCSDVDCLV